MVCLPMTSQGQTVLSTDPTKSWRVLETEHFEIIYDVQERELAEKFAAEAERAQHLLQSILQTVPSKPIPLVIADITDSSNGAATALPRSQIEIYPVLPAVNDPTSEYYDWPREVITHEYTHILNFEPTSGFMGVLKFIFGNIIRPGGFLPRWYTEGLAVEMESRLTPVGRGRSHYYSAFVRSGVEDHTWGTESIARLNETKIPTWPRGQRPYTYGYFLMHELGHFKRKDDGRDNVYHILDERYGSRFPWFIQAPAQDLFGFKYDDLLAKMYSKLEVKAADQINTLKERGAKNGVPLAQEGYFNFGAQISPDRLKLAAIVSDYDDYPSVRVWIRKTPTEPFTLSKEIPKAVISNKDIHQVSWRSDSRHIVYDHSDTYKHYNKINDLYELDVDSGDEKPLTHGLRAREATVLPDGSLVFVAATSTKTQLMASGPNGENPQLLYGPPTGERVSSPRPYHDGVIFSHRDGKGREWIESLNLKTKTVTQRTFARKTGEIHFMPVADSGNHGGFYFASSVSGVMNIYHGDIDRSSYPVTNVTTYASNPEIDTQTQTLIYSRLTGNGLQIETTPASLVEGGQRQTAAIEDYPAAEEAPAPKANITDEHGYHGVSYLWPQYWIPFVYFVPGGVLLDGSTSGADPLNHHQYSLGVGYDSRASQPREEVIYTNQSLPFAIDAIFANDYEYLVGAGLVEHFIYGSLDARFFLSPDSNKWTAGPEVTYKMTDYAPFLLTEMGPGLSVEYNNVATVKDFQVSPESGERFLLGYDTYLANWGNTSYPNVHGNGSLYISGSPLPKHHVINFQASAWVSPLRPETFPLTGTQQAGGEYFGSIVTPLFPVRGYPVGEFLGSTLYVGNFEYRFPVSYPYVGYSTSPIFFSKWSGALICDAITLDGIYYDNSANAVVGAPMRAKIGTFFMGAGGEARVDMTVFYGIPLVMRMGAYYGLTSQAFGGLHYFFGFGSVL